MASSNDVIPPEVDAVALNDREDAGPAPRIARLLLVDLVAGKPSAEVLLVHRHYAWVLAGGPYHTVHDPAVDAWMHSYGSGPCPALEVQISFVDSPVLATIIRGRTFRVCILPPEVADAYGFMLATADAGGSPL